MGNVAEMPMLLSKGMLMSVLWQTEDILFFKVTQKLTNLIRFSARFQIPLEVDRAAVSQIKLQK
jgi:hypothetical protein